MKLIDIIKEIKQTRHVDFITPIIEFTHTQISGTINEVIDDTFKMNFFFGKTKKNENVFYLLIETIKPYVDEYGEEGYTIVEIEDYYQHLNELISTIKEHLQEDHVKHNLLKAGYTQK